MPSSPLYHIIASGESQQVAFLATAEHLKPLGSAVCAFLNASGGILVLGVGKQGEVLGIEGSDRRSGDIQQHLVGTISPTAPWSVSTETLGEKSLIIVDAPQGNETPYVYDDTIYVRLGLQLKAASGPEITELISRRNAQSTRWERLPALGLEINDLETEEILRTAEEGLRRRGYRFSAMRSPSLILTELNLYRGGNLLNSAVVLFGKNPARHYAQLRVRLARLSGERERSFKDSRVLEGNALVLVEQIESFLRRHVEIASELPKSGTRRVDIPAYPFPALREAMMNPLVHRDYAAFDGGISISIYDDRIEFWNSGSLPEGMTLTLTIRAQACGAPTRSDLNSRQLDFLAKVQPGKQIGIAEYAHEFAEGVSVRQARTDLAQLTAAGFLRRQGRGPSTLYVRTEKDF